jgi:hypothetical protein
MGFTIDYPLRKEGKGELPVEGVKRKIASSFLRGVKSEVTDEDLTLYTGCHFL